MRNIKPTTHYLRAIYQDYAERTLAAHPDWWGKYDKSLKMRHCYLYARGRDGKPVLKMSWPLYKEIVSSFFYKAKYAIIQGESLRMDCGLGKIMAIRVERNFAKPVVDWGSTFKANIKLPDGHVKRIYYTGEDYCRIAWLKYGVVIGESHYRFTPAGKNMETGKGFRVEFSQALIDDPLLKYRYKFYPLRKRKRSQPCSTAIAQ